MRSVSSVWEYKHIPYIAMFWPIALLCEILDFFIKQATKNDIELFLAANLYFIRMVMRITEDRI